MFSRSSSSEDDSDFEIDMEVPHEEMEHIPRNDSKVQDFAMVSNQERGARDNNNRDGFRFGRSSDPKEALTNLCDQIRQIKDVSDSDFQNVIFQVNRALAIAPQEGAHY